MATPMASDDDAPPNTPSTPTRSAGFVDFMAAEASTPALPTASAQLAPAVAADSWLSELEMLAWRHGARAAGEPAPKVVIPLHFLVQTTAAADSQGRWTPQAIATLAIDIGLAGVAPTTETATDFFRLAASLIAFLTVHYADSNEEVRTMLGWGTPIAERTGADPVDGAPLTQRTWVQRWLDDLIFEINGMDLTQESRASQNGDAQNGDAQSEDVQSEDAQQTDVKKRVTLFPMLPHLNLTYAGATVAMGDQAETTHVLHDYAEFMAKSLFEEIEEIGKQVAAWRTEAPGAHLHRLPCRG